MRTVTSPSQAPSGYPAARQLPPCARRRVLRTHRRATHSRRRLVAVQTERWTLETRKHGAWYARAAAQGRQMVGNLHQRLGTRQRLSLTTREQVLYHTQYLLVDDMSWHRCDPGHRHCAFSERVEVSSLWRVSGRRLALRAIKKARITGLAMVASRCLPDKEATTPVYAERARVTATHTCARCCSRPYPSLPEEEEDPLSTPGDPNTATRTPGLSDRVHLFAYAKYTIRCLQYQ